MECGAQCVAMGGMAVMLELCVDNWDMMDVSTTCYSSPTPVTCFYYPSILSTTAQ